MYVIWNELIVGDMRSRGYKFRLSGGVSLLMSTALLETPTWRAMLRTDPRVRPFGRTGDPGEHPLHQVRGQPGGTTAARRVGQSRQTGFVKASAPLGDDIGSNPQRAGDGRIILAISGAPSQSAPAALTAADGARRAPVFEVRHVGLKSGGSERRLSAFHPVRILAPFCNELSGHDTSWPAFSSG